MLPAHIDERPDDFLATIWPNWVQLPTHVRCYCHGSFVWGDIIILGLLQDFLRHQENL
jgi:hypothetical protein